MTEIEDVGAFQTPFLLPISFIELVGGVIDTGKNMFMLKGGKKTTMRRLPSGHRTISVLEFNGRWKLPEGLAKELTISSDGNPIHFCCHGLQLETSFSNDPEWQYG